MSQDPLTHTSKTTADTTAAPALWTLAPVRQACCSAAEQMVRMCTTIHARAHHRDERQPNADGRGAHVCGGHLLARQQRHKRYHSHAHARQHNTWCSTTRITQQGLAGKDNVRQQDAADVFMRVHKNMTERSDKITRAFMTVEQMDT